eukprot:TRINITY_DN18649_c0_g1_i1.p1 TRINITY_DN18649_c0_g1~~TRINITY_DN18649_c0_g1_i1.p1  ORF type:complete len:516 (-),score=135.94 TRINITY_DN18649_c0_g1_i1:136-1683(-)
MSLARRGYSRPGSSAGANHQPLDAWQVTHHDGPALPAIHGASKCDSQAFARPQSRSQLRSQGSRRPTVGMSRSNSMPNSRAATADSQTKKNKSLMRVVSASTLDNDIEQVRLLGMDKPTNPDLQEQSGAKDALSMRLKSRSARMEAESLRGFLASYRSCKTLDRESEARLDKQLKLTETRAEDIRNRSEELLIEVAEAERVLERVNSQTQSKQATEARLASMTSFERSQYLINENKREEEVQHQRDEAQNAYHKVHRQLQCELIELRDCKVLLSEYRRIRLDKLEENLSRVEDGRKLRHIVREMLRQGGNRVLARLEATVPLEDWMCQVLVNCCHLELRIEEARKRLEPLQQAALEPLKAQVERMAMQSKEQRFQRLCAWTWDSARETPDEANPWRRPPTLVTSGNAAGDEEGRSSAADDDNELEEPIATSARFASEQPEVLSAEAEVNALQRLLEDTRNNAAAVICSRIRHFEKGSKYNMEWGQRMLTLLVSDDFAKAATKELRKRELQSLLTD